MKVSEACPNCKSADFLKEKMIMIGKFTLEQIYNYKNFEGNPWHSRENLSVDKCNPEYLNDGNLDRFVNGLYCTKCGVGFVPDYMLKN